MESIKKIRDSPIDNNDLHVIMSLVGMLICLKLNDVHCGLAWWFIFTKMIAQHSGKIYDHNFPLDILSAYLRNENDLV